MAEQLYPECKKLSGHSSEMSVIRAFLEWTSENGLEFGQWNGDRFLIASKSTEELLCDYFDIDKNKVDAERKVMQTALAN